MARKRKSNDQDTGFGWTIGRNKTVRNRGDTTVRPIRHRSREIKPTLEQVSAAVTPLRVIVFLIIAILVVNFIPYVDVNCRTQNDAECQRLDEYQSVVNGLFNPVLRFKPMFDQTELAGSLATKPTVASVNVSSSWFNVISVDIVERSPFVLWQSKNGDGEVLVVDKDGIAADYARNLPESESEGLLTIRDESQLEPALGDALIDLLIVEYARQLDESGTVEGYQLEYVDIDDSPREFVAVLRSIENEKRLITVRFTTVRSYEEQLLDLNLTISYLKEQGRSFRYVDVRLESATAYR